ncbi:MAG TPA: alpha/beta hydrolase [Mycobacterium sp.]|nr:alpha/beta hydrolase [Mycobacterium sp.]
MTAAPIPLTTLDDDVNALDRAIDRTEGPVIVVGHAYAGGVIGATQHPRVHALVYVAALAPDQGETVADVFYRDPSHPDAPDLKPDDQDWIWLPVNAFAKAFAQHGTAEQHAVLAAVQRPIAVQCIQQPVPKSGWKGRPSWYQPDHPEIHGRTHAGQCSYLRCRPRSANHPPASCCRHHRRGGTQRSLSVRLASRSTVAQVFSRRIHTVSATSVDLGGCYAAWLSGFEVGKA